MKCSACNNTECEQDYEKRDKCLGEKEDVKCTCACQISRKGKLATFAASGLTGIAAVSGGVAMLTAATGGLLLICSGAALVGAGSSLVMNPFQKQITGECMTMKDTAKDTAFGATIGAITGPIGAGGSALARGASGIVKFGYRSGAGAFAGMVSSGVSEASRIWSGEEWTISSVAKSVGIGALAGAVGGASMHIGSSASSELTSELAKAATRVSVQATATAATDAGLQYLDKREIDPRQVMLNTVGAITVATAAEVSQNVSKRTDAYNKKVNQELIKDNIDKDASKAGNTDELQNKLNSMVKDVNSLPTNLIEDNLKTVNEYNKYQEQIKELNSHKRSLLKINRNVDLSPQQKATLRQDYIAKNNLADGVKVKHINRNINLLKAQANGLRPQFIGKDKMHFLYGDRTGQIAVDLAPPDSSGERSLQRAVFEIHGDKFVYADHTLDHDYEGCRKNVSNLITDPFDTLRPEQFNKEFKDEDEAEHKKKD